MRIIKSTVLVWVLLFVSILSYSQSIDQGFKISEQNTLSFDLKNRIKHLIVNKEFENKSNNKEEHYFFDTSGYIIKSVYKSFYFKQDSANKSDLITNYKYSNGVLISCLSEYYSGLNGYIYELDDNKNIIDEKFYLTDILITDTKFEYDKRNRLTKSTSYSYGIEQSVFIIYKRSKHISVIKTYKYDNKSNIIEETFNNLKGDIYKKYLYTFDSLGNMVQDGWIQDYIHNKSSKVNPLHGYVYNDKNELIKKYCIAKFSPNNTDEYYTYDNNGNEIEVTGYYIKKDTTLGFRIKYEYNNLGNKTKEEIVYGKPWYVGFETYKTHKIKYDRFQRIVLEEYIKADGTIIKVIKSNYSYDKYGNWTKFVKNETMNDVTSKKTITRTLTYY